MSSSWASSPREVTPALANTLRRWNATVLGETQHLRGDLLVRQARGHQLGDLELHRSQLHQGGRVALAGGLPGRTQLRGRPFDQRIGVQVVEDLQGAAQVLAGVDATLGPAQPLPVGEVGASLVVGAARRGVMGQGVLEQGLRLVWRQRRSWLARRRPWPVPTACRCASANAASSSTHPRARSGSPARTAASMRSTAAIRARTGSRNRLR